VPQPKAAKPLKSRRPRLSEVVTEWTGVPSKESLLKMTGADKIEGPGFGGVGTGTRAPEVVTEWKETTLRGRVRLYQGDRVKANGGQTVPAETARCCHPPGRGNRMNAMETGAN
jgi:hypothetical protein